jgi:hypothetical protein
MEAARRSHEKSYAEVRGGKRSCFRAKHPRSPRRAGWKEDKLHRTKFEERVEDMKARVWTEEQKPHGLRRENSFGASKARFLGGMLCKRAFTTEKVDRYI